MIEQYASYFVSYLLTNLKEKKNIFQIILFGSVAKGESTKQSDVDIFVGLKKKNKKQEKEIESVLEEFYKSREALILKSKGVDNKISLIVGNLDDFYDLKSSIESTGIILYGPYISPKKEGTGRKFLIIFWNKIGKNRGAFLNKLYGVKIRSKRYIGLIEKLGGRKIGKSSIIIPIENSKEVLDLLIKYEVDARSFEIFSKDYKI